MTWFIYSLLSIGALAVAELLQQHVLNDDNSIDEKTSVVITFGLQAILAIPLLMLLGYSKDLLSVLDPRIFPYVVGSAVAGTAGMGFYLKSFKVRSISYSQIFIAGSVLVSTTLGVLMFSESVTAMKFLGLLLILGAIASLNYKNAKLEKNHIYGIFAGLLFGVMYSIDKLIVLEINPVVYLFWSFALIVVFQYLLNVRAINSSIKSLKLKDYKPLFVSGIAYLIYNLCTFIAYTKGGEVGRVDAINNAQVFVIIVVEYFLLKEKSDIRRKIATAVIAFSGVYILGTF